jgi:hypothetical protein
MHSSIYTIIGETIAFKKNSKHETPISKQIKTHELDAETSSA